MSPDFVLGVKNFDLHFKEVILTIKVENGLEPIMTE